jgi:hypothetical protein
MRPKNEALIEFSIFVGPMSDFCSQLKLYRSLVRIHNDKKNRKQEMLMDFTYLNQYAACNENTTASYHILFSTASYHFV